MSSPGLKTLSKLQLARETTSGTPVTTATSKLTGLYKIEQQEMRTKVRPQELRGSMAKFFRTITTGKIQNLNVEGTTTFEDFPYFLNMGLKGMGTAAPTSDGGTPPAYTYAYTPTLTDQDVPDTYTIQFGDNLQAYYAEFCFVKTLSLDVQIDALTKMTASIVGRQRTAQAFTGALNDRTTEDLIANNFIVYLDDTGGTIGTTAFSTGVVGLTWTMSNFMPDKTIDGTTVFTGTVEQPLSAEVTMTVELNTAGQAKLAKFTGDTRQLMRLECSGAAIHGAVKKRLRLDGAYNITDWGPIGSADHNGIQTVQLKFTGEYDPTATLIASAEMVNALSALP